MIKIQWTEAGEPENWETFINADSHSKALQQLIEHINLRDAVADFFRVIETGTSVEDRYGREPDKVKPLAQYLFEHDCEYAGVRSSYEYFQRTLDAYESTEQVKIRIEKV
jgi:hypothetical protein